MEQATEKTLKMWHETQRVGQKKKKKGKENGRPGSQIKGKSTHKIGILKEENQRNGTEKEDLKV